MPQYVGPYRVEDLINDLKLCNNGYLFAPNQTQLNVAEYNPFVFTIHKGTIYLQSKFAEQLKARQVVMSAPKRATPKLQGPDYEAMILSCQDHLTFGD